MSEWREVRLGDFFTVKHGYAFKGKNITIEATDDILVTPGNFHIGGGFKSDKFKYFNADYPNEYVLNENDIVITMTDLSKETDTLGYSAKIPASIKGERYLHNQRIGLVQFTNNNANSDFLYWYMRTQEYHGYIVGSASGTSIMHTSPTRIEEHEFLIPTLPEQKAIAEVLSSLDDKIDLLHRQNKTLEQMAETLFRQWFVEEAREDWGEGTLDSVLTVKGGTTPSTKNSDFWDGDIHWTTPRDLSNDSNMYLLDTLRKITKQGLEKISSGLLSKGTLLLSSRAPVGYLAFSDVPIAINQGYIAIIDNKGFSRYWIYLWLKENMDYVKSHANGSTFQEISKTSFRELSVNTPPEDVRKNFDELVKPNFEKIRKNIHQIRTLESLRDTLLPKLMNGEVRITSHG